MEEISPAIAVPFRLRNFIYDDSKIASQMEIAGLELIASTTGLLSEPPLTRLPLVSIACENDFCDNLQNEASRVTVTALEETKEGEPNLSEMIIENGSVICGDTYEQEQSKSVLVSLGGDRLLDNLCSQSVASKNTDICLEDYIAFEATGSPITIGKSALLESDIKLKPRDLTTVTVNSEVTDTNEHDQKLSMAVLKDQRERMVGGTSIQSVLEFDSVPLWGLTSICGRRAEMEDAAVAVLSFLRIPTQMLMGNRFSNDMSQNLSHITAHFFGVYDGHGGSQVANYCRDRIHFALAEEIEITEEVSHNGSVGDNCQQQWEKTFLSCFMKVNAEVAGARKGDGSIANASEDSRKPIAPGAVGSTAVVGIICRTHIIVANCGDSRAVLCRGKVPLPLSVDHKPNREDERERIEAAGGKVIQWDGFRVSGVLAMSRSIGDRYLEPFVIPDPELMFVPRAKEDECLVIATDGLWDVLTNEEVCDVARRRLLLWHKKNGSNPSTTGGSQGVDPAAQDAADYLSRLALQRGSRDNISVIVVDLKAQRKFKRKT